MPPLVKYADINGGDDATFVVYECMTGYMFPDGSNTMVVHCQEDNTWNIDVQFCQGLPTTTHETLILNTHEILERTFEI